MSMSQRRFQPRYMFMLLVAAVLVILSMLPFASNSIPAAGAAGPAPARLRAVHAVPDIAGNPVDVYVNGAKVVTFDFFSVTPYLSVAPGTYRIQVTLAGQNPATQSVINKVVTLESGKDYTAVARGTAGPGNGALGMSIIRDTTGLPPAGQARIKVAHYSPNAPAVDIYVNGSKVISKLNYRDFSPFLNVPAGTYTFGVAPAGGQVIYTVTATLESGKVYTAWANGLLGASGAQAFKVTPSVDRP